MIDEYQLLNIIFGPSEDPRWHYVVDQKDMQPIELSVRNNNGSKIRVEDFEPIDF